MDHIYDLIKSSEWWFTVFFAGIAINLLSTFLSKKLYNISRWWRSRSKNKVLERNKYIENISKNERFLILNSTRHLHCVKYTIVYLFFSAVLLLSAILYKDEGVLKAILFFMGALCGINGMRFFSLADDYSWCAEEAIDKELNINSQ